MRIIPDTYRHISLIKPIERAVSLKTHYDQGIIDTENVVYSIKDFIKYMQSNYKNLFNIQEKIVIHVTNIKSDTIHYNCIIDSNKIEIFKSSFLIFPINYKYIKGYVGKIIFYNQTNYYTNTIHIKCWIAKSKKDAEQIMLENQEEIQEQLRLWSITKFTDKLEEIV